MQENTVENIQIYRKISAKGLMGHLEDCIRKERNTISRNTIHLAFKLGPTTPLREMIIQYGRQILEASELPVEPIFS